MSTSTWDFCNLQIWKLNVHIIAYPIPCMYGIFTYNLVDFYGFHVGKYTVRPMDGSWVSLVLTFDVQDGQFAPTLAFHESLASLLWVSWLFQTNSRLRWRVFFCWYSFFIGGGDQNMKHHAVALEVWQVWYIFIFGSWCILTDCWCMLIGMVNTL